MTTRYDAAAVVMHRKLLDHFGRPVVLIAADGSRHHAAGDWRQDPQLIEQDRAVISTYQAVLGIDLFTWPAGVDLPDTDWLVEIPAASADHDAKAGTWDIADTGRPGSGWLDLFLTNHMPP